MTMTTASLNGRAQNGGVTDDDIDPRGEADTTNVQRRVQS